MSERDELRELRERCEAFSRPLAACQRELAEAKAEIEAAWFGIEHSFGMEPRELIAKESKTNGFKYPLAQAVHTIWKRAPKQEQK